VNVCRADTHAILVFLVYLQKIEHNFIENSLFRFILQLKLWQKSAVDRHRTDPLRDGPAAIALSSSIGMTKLDLIFDKLLEESSVKRDLYSCACRLMDE